jgi:predicted transcriptional regulator
MNTLFVARLLVCDVKRGDAEDRAALARGLADADAGRLIASNEVFERLEHKYSAMLPMFSSVKRDVCSEKLLKLI